MTIFRSTCVAHRRLRKQDNSVEAILSFARLPFGWHFGKGGPINSQVVVDALSVRTLLLDLGATTIEAFPTEGGAIVVSGLNGDDTVDVTVKKGRRYDLFIEQSDKDIADLENVSPSVLEKWVRYLGWRATPYSGYFTLSTSPTRGGVSIARRYSHQKTGSPLSIWHVRKDAAETSAPTSADTTRQAFRATRQSLLA